MDRSSTLLTYGRYSARNMSKPVNFVCVAPSAKLVCLSGDFNGWDRAANPMQRQPDRAWFLQIALHHGHHRYQFVVDGKPVLDPNAYGTAVGPDGTRVSVKAVS